MWDSNPRPPAFKAVAHKAFQHDVTTSHIRKRDGHIRTYVRMHTMSIDTRLRALLCMVRSCYYFYYFLLLLIIIISKTMQGMFRPPTVHCLQYTAYSTLPTVHCLQYTAYSTLPTVHCLQYTAYSTLPTVHCLQYTAYSTLPTVHCLQYTAYSIVQQK